MKHLFAKQIERRLHGWTKRDVLCRLGLHWPRRWESGYGTPAVEELLCQACRFRLRVRPEPKRTWRSLSVLVDMAQRQEDDW